MTAQKSSFYGSVNSAITSGFEDDSSATAVQNRTNKPQKSSSSNAAQSQAYDTTPVPLTQPLFRYQRPSFLDDFDFTAESPHNIVIAPGFISALLPRRAYHSTPASILNFADFDLENTNTKISYIRHDNISPHEKPIASAAVASSSSPSSASLHFDLSESTDTDTVTASAILFQILSLRNARTLLLYVWIACCHECKEKLEYNDIQRLADEQTVAKYERQALRAAVADEENFFWCTSDCGSGQIHDSGSTQPIVVCIKCNHRSCFRHGVNWHEDLSCDEYDRLQEDPEFRSYLELENERWEEAQAAQAAQEEADWDVARRLAAEENAETERQEAQDRRVRERERERERNRVQERERQRNQETQRERERQRNQERQRQLEQDRHEKQRERKRENQEMQRKRERQRAQERQRQLEQERQQRQRELERERQRNQERQRALREKASSRNVAEERRKIAARRREEEAKSNATLRATSKPCGGCGWAIEKSFGWLASNLHVLQRQPQY
ncbi:RING finger Dorfin [Fusarium napiforme]|uniref:RING finger Dorfin n=1 Tax=Fusarium napiforme TaxID=42672 RepID=A0A8H5IFD0_9HYPO|nr:RING finger Dorfin [Fusarium napiforme]